MEAEQRVGWSRFLPLKERIELSTQWQSFGFIIRALQTVRNVHGWIVAATEPGSEKF
jgi:hypothetical protein